MRRLQLPDIVVGVIDVVSGGERLFGALVTVVVFVGVGIERAAGTGVRERVESNRPKPSKSL